VVRQAATEDLRAQVKRLVAPAESESIFRGLSGILDISVSGRQATVVVEDIVSARAALGAAGTAAQEIDLNLDEIFEAYVIGRRKEAKDAEPHLERVA
jgi:ABC-2 type transport system ATP-binding protein